MGSPSVAKTRLPYWGTAGGEEEVGGGDGSNAFQILTRPSLDMRGTFKLNIIFVMFVMMIWSGRPGMARLVRRIRLRKKLKLRRLGRELRLRNQLIEDANDLWSIEKLLEREALDHRRAFLFEDLQFPAAP